MNLTLLFAMISCLRTVLPTDNKTEARKFDGIWYSSTILSSSSPCYKEYSCIDDSTVRVCAPNEDLQTLQEITRVTCPSSSPSCDPATGTCVDKPLPLPVPDLFTCMRDGFYPDFNNCSRYYLCVNGVPYLYEINEYDVYYCPGFKCYGPMQYVCNSFNYSAVCEGFTGVKVGIPVYPFNMFVFCSSGTVSVLDRCLGGYQFNTTSQQCEPSCPYPGLFPSAEDCAQYYRCTPITLISGDSVSSGTVGTITFHTCPEGQAFLEEEYQCVNRSLVSNCRLSPQFFS